MELVKVRNDARKKLGETGFGVSRTTIGGTVTSFMSWRAIDSLADLDTPSTFTARWRESAGDAFVDKWYEDILAIVATGQERDIYVLEESLSFYPER
jgi:hypothetical protein